MDSRLSRVDHKARTVEKQNLRKISMSSGERILPTARSFDDFRNLAKAADMDRSVKSGDPTNLREGSHARIAEDIIRKIPALQQPGSLILDIGPGVGEVPFILIDHCEKMQQKLLLSDSAEVLGNIPDRPGVVKLPGHFPDQCEEWYGRYSRGIDGIIIYSVIHYVLPGYDLFGFFDRALNLLKEGGVLLIGDIPNVSKRRRFLASENGARFHKQYMKTTEDPKVHFNTLEFDLIDDAIVLALMLRARSAGFDAYVVPQPADLPYANRREDMIVVRP
jgi:hypothetical protein